MDLKASSAPSARMAMSQDGKKEHAIFPVNGFDEEALAKTESNIQRITQLPKVFSFRERSNNNKLRFWVVKVTDTQLQEIKKDDGIDGAEMNSISEKGSPLWSYQSKLEDVLTCEPEKKMDYVHFSLVSVDKRGPVVAILLQKWFPAVVLAGGMGVENKHKYSELVFVFNSFLNVKF